MLDYIIVGMGLSGASLALRLEQRKKRFLVFEDASQNASKVAGGIINPVILKRFTLAWKADVNLKKAVSFYHEQEKYLDQEFFKSLDIYRRFTSTEEQNDWFAASDQLQLQPFLDTALISELNRHISDEFSFGKLQETYKLDTEKYLEATRNKLLPNNLKLDFFDYSALKISNSEIEYKGIRAKYIVFCEGFGLLKNPFFNYLPLRGNKGEYLLIKAPDLKLKAAVKSSIFLVPLGNDLYQVGATYNPIDKSPETTQKSKEILIQKLQQFLTCSYEIVDQQAGIRPTTVDRRPLVGRHPQLPNLYCCNGFGSHGVLAAPALSEELLDYIELGTGLDQETDITRFEKKYFKAS